MYLELTPDMLILSFIEAVKRFVSRRCMPDQLISVDFKLCSLVKVKITFSVVLSIGSYCLPHLGGVAFMGG